MTTTKIKPEEITSGMKININGNHEITVKYVDTCVNGWVATAMSEAMFVITSSMTIFLHIPDNEVCPDGQLVWSETWRLLGYVDSDDACIYHIINGNWTCRRRGDTSECIERNNKITITDWEFITRKAFNTRHPNFGY